MTNFRPAPTTRRTRATAPSRPPAAVAFVGVGPGDAGLLTLRAVDRLGSADAVVVDQFTAADLVSRYAAPGAEIVDASRGEHGQPLTHAQHAKLVVRTARTHPGGLVVRLMDGDPSVFNGLAEEASACASAGVPFEIVPGVSAVHAVPAYAGVPLTAATSTSIHVLGPTSTEDDVAGSVADSVTVVALGSPKALTSSLAALLAAGRAPNTPVAITQRGTSVEQATVTTTLEHASGVVSDLGVPCLLVAGPTVALRESLSWFETRALYGWRVLVPATKEPSTGLTTRLERCGAQVSVVPTISVEPPRTPQQMTRAITGLVTGRYQWVGFTSVNAVRAVREKLDEYGLDARSFAGLKIAAVSGPTAAALRDWGLVPDHVPTGEQSAHGLLQDWPEFDEDLDPINRVFLPRADIATETLVAGLKGRGWEVDDVTAYRTVRAAPPPQRMRDAIKSGAFDAVVFTSSSTVRNLVGIAGKPHSSTIIACIGPQTAKAVEEHGLRVDVLAPEPTTEAVVDALADHGRALALAAADAGGPVLRPSERRMGARRRAR